MASRAETLHRQAIVIDGLNISRWGDEEVYRHLHQGGLTGVHASLVAWENQAQALQKLGRIYRDFRTYGQWIRPVERVGDFHKAKQEGRVGLFLGFQNSTPLEGNLHMVEVFHRLGVRAIQLTYNDLNEAGAGCYERKDVGLSQFGVDLVQEMNRVGMTVDLSHVGYQSTMDAIEVSEAPVWFSHVNPAGLVSHVRNKTDEQVRALVEKGGVVGANIFPPFLRHGYESTIDDLLDVIDYWVGLAGEDHVSIGLDFTENHPADWFHWLMQGKRRDSDVTELPYPMHYPKGIARADEFPNITAGLVERGYSDEAIGKILGGNVLRLFERTWPA